MEKQQEYKRRLIFEIQRRDNKQVKSTLLKMKPEKLEDLLVKLVEPEITELNLRKGNKQKNEKKI